MQCSEEYLAALVNEAYRLGGIDAEYNDERLREGDKVKVNLEQIMGRKNFYEHTSSNYRGLLESMTGKEVYTVKSDDGALIELDEFPVWLWWAGDLILVKE